MKNNLLVFVIFFTVLVFGFTFSDNALALSPAKPEKLPDCVGTYFPHSKCGGTGPKTECENLIPPNNAKVGDSCGGYTDPYFNSRDKACLKDGYKPGGFGYQCVVQNKWVFGLGGKVCRAAKSNLFGGLKPIKSCNLKGFPGTTENEGCFVKISIKEKKIKDIKDKDGKIIDQEIKFSDLATAPVFGNYRGLVNFYDKELKGDYALNVYDGSGKLVNKYALYSSRFIFYDTFDEKNPGGVIEEDQGVISAVIVNTGNIKKIKIEKDGKETDLFADNHDFSCQRTCKIENEAGNYGNDSCCLAFTPVTTDNEGNFTCVNTADGVCSGYETEYNSPEDCGPSCDLKNKIKKWKERKTNLEEVFKEAKKCRLLY